MLCYSSKHRSIVFWIYCFDKNKKKKNYKNEECGMTNLVEKYKTMDTCTQTQHCYYWILFFFLFLIFLILIFLVYATLLDMFFVVFKCLYFVFITLFFFFILGIQILFFFLREKKKKNSCNFLLLLFFVYVYNFFHNVGLFDVSK